MSRFREACLRGDGTLLDAMRALERSRTQIVLVVDEGDRLLGTLTDGDIRRALVAGSGLDARVGAHFNPRFVSVGPEAGRAEVIDLMQARAVHQIPIVDETGRVCGLHLVGEMLGAPERPNWAVVMAGGRGTRLLPLTAHVPKPMLKVAGRPILERLVLHLVGSGVRRIFLSINYLGEVIEAHFGDGARFGCSIEYLRESRPLGTGGALSLLPSRPSAPLIALNGDLVVQFDVGQMLGYHERGGHVVTVGVHDYTHTVPFGVVALEDGRITEMREKPTEVWPTNAGIYVIEPRVLDRVPRDAEFPLPGLVEQCLQHRESVGGFPIDDWIDVGRTSELERARGTT